jgi:DNA-binding MarR family transcriptional regulator
MRWSALSMQVARADGMPQMLRLLNEHNLSMPMMVVLHLLAFEGTQTMTRLAERTGLSTSATSHLIQRLVEGRLVDRTEGAVDRRVREIALTPAGQDLTAEMLRQRFSDLRASVAPLSDTTRARLAAAITDVTIELAAALGTGMSGCPGAGDPVGAGEASKKSPGRKATGSKRPARTLKSTSKERS